jgi:type II secretory pathway component GspD/PulD (secretin)
MLLIKKNYEITKLLLVLCLSLFLAEYLTASQEASPLKPIRTRVITLTHLSAEKAKEYLDKLKIGDTISKVPVNNALIVSASPIDLIKATAVSKLIDVDSEDEFVIKTVALGPEARKRFSNEKISKLLTDMSIGTFIDPPTKTKSAAIIDIHNDDLLVLASEKHLDRILRIIEQLETVNAAKDNQIQSQTLTLAQKMKLDSYPPAELAVQSKPEPTQETKESKNETDMSELFNKLLKSLDEAEKKAEEEALKLLPQPTEPEIEAAPESLESTQEEEIESEPPSVKPAVELPETTQVEPPGKPEIPDELLAESKEEEEIETIPPVYEEMIIPNGEEQLELDLPEKVDIISLLDLVGTYLKLDYLYDPIKVRGDVTLKVQGPLKLKDLYSLLESVLKFKGFAMSRKGNLVTIVPIGEALNTDPALRINGEAIQPGDVVMTRIFSLDYINTNTAKTLLAGMKLGAEITELPETNQLIITDFAYRMGRIEQLLILVDEPGEPKQFKFRQLKYIMANTLTPKIIALVEQLGTVSISVATETRTPPRRTKGPA